MIEQLIKEAIQASILGGDEILSVYKKDAFDIEIKEDKSPVTEADKKSSDAIINHLQTLNIPILSEEVKAADYKDRKNWKQLWVIDPLDGTKEFIKKNGEFTVNIGFVENNSPLFGIIYIPVTEEIYYGGKNIGTYKLLKQNFNYSSFKIKNGTELPNHINKDKYIVTGSRSHGSKETEAYFNSLKSKHDNLEFLKVGSAVKFCRMAEGKIDLYPRFQYCMEWDTAAGHALLQGIGKEVKTIDSNTTLVYNKEDLLSPFFIAG